MSHFSRYLRQQYAHLDEANIRRAIGHETFDHTADPTPRRHYAPTAADNRRLRGIPAIGPGVTGAIPNTRPGDNLWR